MTDKFVFPRALALTLATLLLATAAQAQFSPAKPAAKSAKAVDYIVAVVNNELVTQVEVEQRLAQIREEAARSGATLPPPAELRQKTIDSLIDERVIITNARDSGYKVDEQEIDRAAANIASVNKMTMAQLRQRLAADGVDYAYFRTNLRDQILTERAREREVNQRIKISDADIDRLLEEQKAKRATTNELNIAQILITVPEGASPDVVAQRRAVMAQAQARLKSGEPFLLVAKAMSEDGNRDKGGEMGERPADRYPDLFVNAVKDLAVGAVTAEPVRSGAGFHLLKLLSRADTNVITVMQTHARHILLRPSATLTTQAAEHRLEEFRDQILAGKRSFEDLAREFSEDGSAANGGDLGWTPAGSFVPEFEEAMNRLEINGLSAPVVSRFGVHLIQVLERRFVPVDPRQAREQARNTLREQKFPAAYKDWVEELRSKAYIEMREPPL
jgi:peptidyl-prolyl cis-trans isomerase SurA